MTDAAGIDDQPGPSGHGEVVGHRRHHGAALPHQHGRPPGHPEVGIEPDPGVAGDPAVFGHEVEIVGLVPEQLGAQGVPPVVGRFRPRGCPPPRPRGAGRSSATPLTPSVASAPRSRTCWAYRATLVTNISSPRSVRLTNMDAPIDITRPPKHRRRYSSSSRSRSNPVDPLGRQGGVVGIEQVRPHGGADRPPSDSHRRSRPRPRPAEPQAAVCQSTTNGRTSPGRNRRLSRPEVAVGHRGGRWPVRTTMARARR